MFQNIAPADYLLTIHKPFFVGHLFVFTNYVPKTIAGSSLFENKLHCGENQAKSKAAV